jgi:hypothetical protein
MLEADGKPGPGAITPHPVSVFQVDTSSLHLACTRLWPVPRSWSYCHAAANLGDSSPAWLVIGLRFRWYRAWVGVAGGAPSRVGVAWSKRSARQGSPSARFVQGGVDREIRITSAGWTVHRMLLHTALASAVHRNHHNSKNLKDSRLSSSNGVVKH